MAEQNTNATKRKVKMTRSVAEATAEKPTCTVEACKQSIRAKGYCRKHFMAWRKGQLGTKQRYMICTKEGCRKKAVTAGRCEEHKRGSEKKAA